MALTATQIADAMVSAKGYYYGKFENRPSVYGAFQAFLDNAEKLLPKSMIEGVKESPVHKVQISMLNKYAATLLQSRSCEITGDEVTSAVKALSWATKGFKIQVTPALNQDNYISDQDSFAHQLAMGMKTVQANLDTVALNTFEVNKSAILAASKLATQENAAYKISFKDYEAKKLYASIPGIMSINDLEGPFIDVANGEEQAMMKWYATLGAQNQQDINMLLGQDFMFYLTNRLNPGDNRAIHYVAPEGSIGVYNWVDWEARTNAKLNEGDKKYTLQDPILGITWGVHERNVCVNVEGRGSCYSTIYEFTSDFAFVSAYSSDTSSPIVKFVVEDQTL